MTLAAASTLDEVRLTRGDVDEVYRLYLSALSRLPNPAAVRPDEPAFFDEIFAVGGGIVGFRDGPQLIAYGVLRPVLDSEHDRTGLASVVPAEAPLMVLDGSAVAPAYWRRGLQRAIIDTRIAEAARLGASHVIAKASPGNIPSMRNLLKCGFATVALVRKPYGWRYVNHRPVAAPVRPAADCQWMEAGRIDEAQDRFQAGEAAFACRAQDDGIGQLKFGPLRGGAA
ncbi:GNAT family N-acetyltransferase [Acuticoccus sp. MNP-M23]|uniref:GNAT family N-acetyltransferase n=1 Tax=Acuticoccus sp. MNP-M23 TaxID=3072793 RepID=UPI0028157846|nr:GNAT family N-acetyltransferase [Acuticoccus sp. MNP-M23]WMS42981.1 GNAT family N-acetyltransferase [Acuticoccus sp. MNP-M23]